ncbi:hypothetical protein KI688_007124 [Linnemannia hyalina]|uniref:Uncharacterized protein n=1 Tax=Linnemannia hyalina TaxID=64524 RepID=A0A9P7XHI9_9FUNG|nr:hypothetical protein KI688_007124 [Linnemannia hyalina]
MSGTVSHQDFQLVSDELALIEQENRALQTQLRAAIDQKVTLENLSRDRDSDAFNQWKNERQQLELEYTERIEELQEVSIDLVFDRLMRSYIPPPEN